MVIIWLNGTYGVGKTSVAREIKSKIFNQNAVVLESDDFFWKYGKRNIWWYDFKWWWCYSANNKLFLERFKEKLELYNKYYTALVHLEQRVKHTKWCILRYPNEYFAKKSNMTLNEFKDFYYNVCNVDYNKMKIAMEPLKELMNKTDKVHIVAPGTDLTFSINGIPAEKYYGTFNIPDGEVATCPVKNSVNGYITYNTKTKYNDIIFEDIKFDFINGKIVKATAKENSKELNEILDTDDGARYIGEFAFGLNPYVNNTMCDTLFDEKINGSFHLTPGMALEESDNGNRSAIHWDIVKILRKEFGGGEIYFDDILIMKDGKFILEELKELNAENLK